jgi:hypothetical protein
VPLSGANKMPNTAPAAAPANTLAKTFPAPIILNFKFYKCCLNSIKTKYIAKKKADETGRVKSFACAVFTKITLFKQSVFFKHFE